MTPCNKNNTNILTLTSDVNITYTNNVLMCRRNLKKHTFKIIKLNHHVWYALNIGLIVFFLEIQDQHTLTLDLCLDCISGGETWLPVRGFGATSCRRGPKRARPHRRTGPLSRCCKRRISGHPTGACAEWCWCQSPWQRWQPTSASGCAWRTPRCRGVSGISVQHAALSAKRKRIHTSWSGVYAQTTQDCGVVREHCAFRIGIEILKRLWERDWPEANVIGCVTEVADAICCIDYLLLKLKILEFGLRGVCFCEEQIIFQLTLLCNPHDFYTDEKSLIGWIVRVLFWMGGLGIFLCISDLEIISLTLLNFNKKVKSVIDIPFL